MTKPKITETLSHKVYEFYKSLSKDEKIVFTALYLSVYAKMTGLLKPKS